VPTDPPSFFLAKNRQKATLLQISRHISPFSQKEFIKLCPWGGGDVSPQVWLLKNPKKHCPTTPEASFSWRKIDTGSNF
jgi:hypothetical protein